MAGERHGGFAEQVKSLARAAGPWAGNELEAVLRQVARDIFVEQVEAAAPPLGATTVSRLRQVNNAHLRQRQRAEADARGRPDR